jgi:YaiO family outer membrane protein
MTAEIGARHLNFGGGGTTIYTASLTKYRGQYMYRAGTYLTPGSTGTSASVNAMARRYLSGSQTYVGANASIGSSPTGARADAFEEDFQRTRSWSVSAHAQVAVAQRTVLGISIGYDSEEIVSGTRRRISSTVSVSYEF